MVFDCTVWSHSNAKVCLVQSGWTYLFPLSTQGPRTICLDYQPRGHARTTTIESKSVHFHAKPGLMCCTFMIDTAQSKKWCGNGSGWLGYHLSLSPPQSTDCNMNINMGWGCEVGWGVGGGVVVGKANVQPYGLLSHYVTTILHLMLRRAHKPCGEGVDRINGTWGNKWYWNQTNI